MPAVQFYRNYRFFTGGHLKVFHYFQHFDSFEDYRPLISFTPGSVIDSTNPWHIWLRNPPACDELERPDLFFLAGLDWLRVEQRGLRDSSLPVINLIQHVRHARRDDIRYEFLKKRAIRICVGEEVRDVLLDTGIVNGPLVVFPNAIDYQPISEIAAAAVQDIDLLVVCNKQPEMGVALTEVLKGLSARVRLHASQVPREEFIRLLSRAAVTVFLPDRLEGFYLPALEGMAAGTLVVCPDCVGNRSFCIPDQNCFRPLFESEAVLSAIRRACALSHEESMEMRLRARQTACSHDLAGERDALRSLLANLDQIW